MAEVLTPQVRRAQPWHAGPEATARDLAALRFVGEHYAARSDVLAAVLGRLSPAAPRSTGRLGHRTVRQRVERWEAAGWAVRRRMLDHTWVLPTRAGLRLAGLELDPWTPAVDRLAHHQAAAVVRLHRELGGRPPVAVEPLPQVPGVAYMPARGEAA